MGLGTLRLPQGEVEADPEEAGAVGRFRSYSENSRFSNKIKGAYTSCCYEAMSHGWRLISVEYVIYAGAFGPVCVLLPSVAGGV